VGGIPNACVKLSPIVFGLNALWQAIMVTEEGDHCGEFFLSSAFKVLVGTMSVGLVLVQHEGGCVHGTAESVQLLTGSPRLEPSGA